MQTSENQSFIFYNIFVKHLLFIKIKCVFSLLQQTMPAKC